MSDLLSIDGLSVQFGRTDDRAQVVNQVSLEVKPGEKVALVGESGSGKSVTAMSVLRLHDPSLTHYPEGKIHFEGKDLLHLSQSDIRKVRGKDISMISMFLFKLQ